MSGNSTVENGLRYTQHGRCTAFNAALQILKGHRWRTFASIYGTQIDRSLLFSIGWPIVRMPFCYCWFMPFGRKSQDVTMSS